MDTMVIGGARADADLATRQSLCARPDRRGAGRRPLAAATLAETLRSAASKPPEAGLRTLVDLAVRVGPWESGGITAVDRRGTPRTVAHAGGRALTCSAAQHDLGEGPAIDAVATGASHVGTDLADGRRWPRWSAVAAAAGVEAALSVRLFTDVTIGTLDLYSAVPVEVDAVVAGNAEVVAAHASVLLSAHTTRLNLERAISTRTLIGQAQGILMYRYGLTPRAAFDLLRRISQQRNIRLAVLAECLVDGGTLPDLDTG